MKPIRFPLNHFNLIVYSFQPAGMDGKPVMVENAIGILSSILAKAITGPILLSRAIEHH